MDSPSELRHLVDGKNYSESIQAAMRVPSCISLQGFDSDDSPVHEKKSFEKIILRTPPTTLKLDDSDCWNTTRNTKVICLLSPRSRIEPKINKGNKKGVLIWPLKYHAWGVDRQGR